MVFLMETKLNKKRMEKVRRSYGFTNGIDIEAEGSRGGLCLAWKGDIKRWASNIRRSKEGLKRKLSKDIEILLEKEKDDETMAKIIDTKIHLNIKIDKDEMYWEQRARVNWLLLGDKNSAFFHKCASACRRINTISRLESDDGREITDGLEISETATLFF
ncbi:hypothetical protein J1N35_011717 [Gossypium stocksii]|uniref:Reverse transcriptase n=1 Tax=Gossypium stocksii TaxID=47602 RepID=A0A9D3W2J6_9ROSI|nr:hypothetical protein J1N35_011717 [Gossypium stocksii]